MGGGGVAAPPRGGLALPARVLRELTVLALERPSTARDDAQGSQARGVLVPEHDVVGRDTLAFEPRALHGVVATVAPAGAGIVAFVSEAFRHRTLARAQRLELRRRL